MNRERAVTTFKSLQSLGSSAGSRGQEPVKRRKRGLRKQARQKQGLVRHPYLTGGPQQGSGVTKEIFFRVPGGLCYIVSHVFKHLVFSR